MSRINWGPVLEVAEIIVLSYDTGVTLRQLHYQLVSRPELGYPNTQNAYKQLSSRTAEKRRSGDFPRLVDQNRKIHQPGSFSSPRSALSWLTNVYRLDRTEGQEFNVYVGAEKNGLVNQLTSWFGDRGVPVLALGGYAGQSYVDDVAEHISGDGRGSVLLYAGDFDPSGVDILRDFGERVGGFDQIVRVALNAEQVIEYNLPPMPGKETDSRAAGFRAKFGELVQVEVDALDPTTLRSLLEAELDAFWDTSEYDSVIAREHEHRGTLAAALEAVS